MKRKSMLIIAILIMAIGFAAISTTLVINGSVSVGENTDDYNVIFTAASLDGQDVYNTVIDDTKKIINFTTNDLKTLNQTSVLTYEVTNNSANYDAEVVVNCKVKDNLSAKHTSIENILEGNATEIKAKTSLNGTLTITLNKTSTEEAREEYTCEITATAKERDTLGIPDPVSFASDSWGTIQKAVQTDNTSLYNVGDTKSVDLGDLGTHIVRLANKSECTTETSETACGFVVEFADIITEQKMNSTNKNVGGWPASEARTYINSTIYESLPSDLQNVITSTKVISGHGSTSGEKNFTSTDKLYLLSTKEVWGETKNDTLNAETKQLDYYKQNNVSLSKCSKAIKQYNGSNTQWWIRSADSVVATYFSVVYTGGGWYYSSSHYTVGISPAFRIA